MFQFPFHRDRLCNKFTICFGSGAGSCSFNSLFIGIGSAIRRDGLAPGRPILLSFNSLFIGIGSAICPEQMIQRAVRSEFQFPFHRDRLCNLRNRYADQILDLLFQFPFHRDRLCNWEYESPVACKLNLQFQFPFHRDRLCNQSGLEYFSRLSGVSIPFSSG